MEEDKKPSILIATPMYGGLCSGEYTASLIKTMMMLRNLKVPTYYAHMMNESLITRARNELARLFLEKGYDYLMFIDADIHFPHDAIPALLLAEKDIVCGIYPKKEINWSSINKAVQEGKPDIHDHAGAFVFNMVQSEEGFVETDESGVLEVRHGGTGFMLIKRSVFEELMPHVPTYRTSTFKDPVTDEYVKPLTHEFFATSIDHTGALLSEDYHFCELWRKHGGKVYAHPFIKLQHMGSYIYQGDILKSGGNIK